MLQGLESDVSSTSWSDLSDLKTKQKQKTKLKTKDDSKVDPRFLIKALPL